MNLAQLYYFRKLAQLEHYTKTAQELFISQPSLSSSIAAMEDELQIKLFQKKGRNVKLTKDGKEFYGHVCRALDALQDGIDSAHEKSGALSGSIDIAAPPALLINFVPDLIQSYRKDQHSQVKFNLFNEPSPTCITDRIQDGTYDFGFCANTAAPDTLFSIPVMSQEFVAFVSKSNPLARKQNVTFQELADREVMTYPEDSEAGQTIYPILEQHNITPAHTFTDEFAVNGYISQNDKLVVIAAKTAILEQCSSLVHIPIADMPQNLSAICLLYSKKNHITKPMERFLTFVTEQYKI